MGNSQRKQKVYVNVADTLEEDEVRFSIDVADQTLLQILATLSELPVARGSAPKSGRALRDAARRGDLARVKSAVEAHNVNPDSFSPVTGFTALQLAVLGGHADIVDYLVQRKADINLVNHWSVTPLYYAGMCGHTDIVKYLMAQDGIDVDHKTTTLFTALNRAALEGHFGAVRALVEGDRDAQQHPEKRQERLDAWNGLKHTSIYQAAWKVRPCLSS